VSNLDTVKEIYAAFGRGDVPAILDKLDENVEWETAIPVPGVPWLQTRRGRVNISAFFESLAPLSFQRFEPQPSASASLGQVHRAVAHDGRMLAAKLQYPDMQSAVEADLNQLKVVFALHARMNPAIDTGEMLKEIAARLREELDYDLEWRHMALYALIFKDEPSIRVPEVLRELSTRRLLTMTWLEGRPLLDYKGAPLLMNVWATWCDPCREEMPSLERLYREYRERGLRVVAISIDDGGQVDLINEFVSEHGLTFDVLHDPKSAIMRQYPVRGVPQTFLISRDGEIRATRYAEDWYSAANRALVDSLIVRDR